MPGLDDSDRVHRLGYVAAVTDAAAEDALLDGVRHAWRARLGSWPAGASVYDAAVSVLGRASLSWVAASLEGHVTDAVASDIAVSLDGRGLVGPATLRAARARRRAAAWSADAVAAARTGRTRPAAGSALAVMARATTERGQLLSEATAGEVLLHLVRPALAAARLAPFAALALHAQPQWRERVRREAAERSLATPGPLALALARRLRLATPGIPVVASVARRESLFRGRAVPAGTLLLLDVAGTPQPLDLGEDVPGAVPRRLQASGEDQPAGCRRDQMITAALAVTAAELALAEWTVPEQDLRVPLHRMPTLPRSGVVLGGVSHALAPSGR